MMETKSHVDETKGTESPIAKCIPPLDMIVLKDGDISALIVDKERMKVERDTAIALHKDCAEELDRMRKERDTFEKSLLTVLEELDRTRKERDVYKKALVIALSYIVQAESCNNYDEMIKAVQRQESSEEGYTWSLNDGTRLEQGEYYTDGTNRYVLFGIEEPYGTEEPYAIAYINPPVGMLWSEITKIQNEQKIPLHKFIMLRKVSGI